jgi:DNA sulfur modification protein DndB
MNMTFDEKLVSGVELKSVYRKRRHKYQYQNIYSELQVRYEQNGWSLHKVLKNSIQMKKEKEIDEQFEDEVWTLLASMGFSTLNRDRYFNVAYDSNNSTITKQIDVFAVDEETILFIECKSAETIKKSSFKEEIEAIGGIKQGLYSRVRKVFPNRKIKYIFAIKNYILSQVDLDRLKTFDIHYFDEKVINYYSELSKHLGTSSRYQLLGQLFADQKIAGMDNKVAAIEGKMGGYLYYSFNIEPEKLLKIGYVLHRSEANSSMMPTYQRIIKKNRLNDIQKFVESGGFFPNSLIINIEAKNKPKFDLASIQVKDSSSKVGILHLPQRYRSAYIIDGQHRLYGYADSKYGVTNTVPVVAFVNLSKEKQIKIFMEINENQKAVSKNLQNILNADLLWSSEDYNERRKALRLSIAQELGDNFESPLYSRVIIGESEKNSEKCITIETIQEALKKTNFFTQFGKGNEITKAGTYDKGTNELTKDVAFKFLCECFNYIKTHCEDEWNKGEEGNGILTVNIGVYAMIRVFSDIVDVLINIRKIDPKQNKPEDVADELYYYLDPLITFIENITTDDRTKLRKAYGGNGKTKAWRTFQQAIAKERSEFTPEGLEEWMRDNAKLFNEESFSFIIDIEREIKDNVLSKLQEIYLGNWISGVPKDVYTKSVNTAAKMNYENNSIGGKEIEPWECISLADCQKIITFGKHWSEFFEKQYTMPGDEGRKGGTKALKTQWLNRLSKIREQQNSPTYSVLEKDYELIKNIHSWLVKKRYK